MKKKNLLRGVLSNTNLRITSVVTIISIAFIIITVRILILTFGKSDGTKEGQNFQRGMITDINNIPIAFSEERYNLYYNPKKGILDNETITSISKILGDKVNTAQIYSGLDKKKTFLLARYAEKNIINHLIELKLPGILVDRVNYRLYPYDNFLSQTLGFVGHDGEGLHGLEFKYNEFLNYRENPGYERSLVLNINLDFQKKIGDLIKSTVKKNGADYGSIIVQELQTGHLVGLANYPNFNLNFFEKYPNQAFLNRANTYLLEPGSIFKIFFAAYLIEKFNPTLNEKKYNCEGYYELSNGEIIKCHGVHGAISLQDIIKYSCNSGIIQATEDISPEEMFSFLKRLHIGESHGVDLPGESRGIILDLENWGIRTRATIPLGHGIAISPIHLINIFSALIGKGYLYQPHVVRSKNEYQNGKLIYKEEVESKVINKIISDEISRKVVNLLYYGTIKDSTGYSSRSTGFEQVFGKTATSQLANIAKGGYYTNRYHSMFAGGYPIENPKYSILVVVSRPKKEYYGGTVAAPIYAQVVEAINTHYNLTEERNVETIKSILSKESPNDAYIEEFLSERIPNFINLSTRKAITLLEDFKKIQKQKNIKVKYHLKGSGYVAQQTPPPGSPIKHNLTITLMFK